ncbi:MAG: zinc-binding alcohol dehydrogenase family protein [Desulfurococcaceae archaeon]
MKAAVLYENAEIKVENLPRRIPDLPWKQNPLDIVEVDTPEPKENQVLIRVEACGVCYTDIDIIEGRVKCKIPVIPGHQIIGRIEEVSKNQDQYVVKSRVGVAWIAKTCGTCEYCRRNEENLCVDFKATGCHMDGGYAEYVVAYKDYVYEAPGNVEAAKLAPLLCAGSVGYRGLKLADVKGGMRLGLFGFGSSAHIIIQIVRKLYPDVEIYVFTRSQEHKDLAMKLGADWTGSPQEDPPRKLDRAIDFTPIGETVVRALELLKPGGRLVVNVIRKQTPIQLTYDRHLWLEKEVKSVANVTRRDVKELLQLAGRVPIEVHVEEYGLIDVNKALRALKSAKVKGSVVLKLM